MSGNTWEMNSGGSARHSMMPPPLSEPLPLQYFVEMEVRRDKQAKPGVSGEVRQTDGAATQRRHTVNATLDQLSLQLYLHSELINMTAGRDTQLTQAAAEVITCSLICIHVIADLSTFSRTPPHLLYMRAGIKLGSLLTHHWGDEKNHNTHVDKETKHRWCRNIGVFF